jgi:hypothetical protein
MDHNAALLRVLLLRLKLLILMPHVLSSFLQARHHRKGLRSCAHTLEAALNSIVCDLRVTQNNSATVAALRRAAYQWQQLTCRGTLKV